VHRRRRHGRAVQVDLSKPTLKAPGTKPLKLKCGESLSNFAFNFNLRRYITETGAGVAARAAERAEAHRVSVAAAATTSKVGSYTRPLFSST